MPNPRDQYAIVVGIQRYPQLPEVAYATADATQLASWLSARDGGALPADRVFLLTSGAATESDSPGPRLIDLERAIRNLGVESGAHVGERLYLYFAGYASSRPDGDLVLACADVGEGSSGGVFHLESLCSLVRSSGCFDELVVIVDYAGLPAGLAAQSVLQPPPLWTDVAAAPREIALAKLAHERPSAAAEGLLTAAVLECLRHPPLAGAADLTFRDLVQQALARVAEHAGPVAVKAPRSVCAGRDIVLKSVSADGSLATLVVEVPHWSAQVRIYDHLLRPVQDTGAVEPDAQHGGIHRIAARLPQGMYHVEVSLEGVSQRELIALGAGGSVVHKSWSDFGAISAAPVTAGGETSERQLRFAREWSMKSTSEKTSGESRLFVFVRAADSARAAGKAWFPADLTLHDGSGSLVSDFSGDVQYAPDSPCFAYSAALPSGYYIVRRGGTRVRQQGVYLCAGMQTQIFIVADERSSLRRWVVDMAAVNVGFRPEDDSLSTAAAVLDALRGRRSLAIDSAPIAAVLAGAIQSPWLGVLAGYALLNLSKDDPDAGMRERASTELRALLPRLAAIADHPDVRALRIDRTVPSEPFEYPPMLRAGLERVRRHATRFSSTVPVGSLTDYALEHALGNAPWTAWRESPHTERWTSAVGTFLRERALAPLVQYGAGLAGVVATIAPLLLKRMQNAWNTEPLTLESVAAITRARELLRTYPIERLPATDRVNTQEFVDTIVQKSRTAEIAGALGVPLSRLENEIKQFIAANKHHLRNSQLAPVLTPIVQYLMAKLLNEDEERAGEDGGERYAAVQRVRESTRLVGCVTALRNESDRLEIGQRADAAGAPGQLASLTSRLDAIAELLLKHALFVAVTAERAVTYASPGFKALVSQGEGRTLPPEEIRLAEREWAAALRGAEASARFADPTQLRAWTFCTTRTVLEDADDGQVLAQLNVLRVADAGGFRSEALDEIERCIPTLTLDASLVVHGSRERRATCLEQLERSVAALEDVARAAEVSDPIEIGIGVPASAAVPTGMGT